MEYNRELFTTLQRARTMKMINATLGHTKGHGTAARITTCNGTIGTRLFGLHLLGTTLVKIVKVNHIGHVPRVLRMTDNQFGFAITVMTCLNLNVNAHNRTFSIMLHV